MKLGGVPEMLPIENIFEATKTMAVILSCCNFLRVSVTTGISH